MRAHGIYMPIRVREPDAALNRFLTGGGISDHLDSLVRELEALYSRVQDRLVSNPTDQPVPQARNIQISNCELLTTIFYIVADAALIACTAMQYHLCLALSALAVSMYGILCATECGCP